MPKKSPLIYLASASSRRKEILERMGVNFRVVKSTYHEKNPAGKINPEHLVLQHAIGKAVKALTPQSAIWVIGAATTVVLKDEIYGKPRSRKAAKVMLQSLSGKTNRVLTGICLLNRVTSEIYFEFDETKVTMKRLTAEAIATYHDVVYPLDKAGAYAIQEGPKIVETIDGSYSNVVGLPKELVRKLLRKIVK